VVAREERHIRADTGGKWEEHIVVTADGDLDIAALAGHTDLGAGLAIVGWIAITIGIEQCSDLDIFFEQWPAINGFSCIGDIVVIEIEQINDTR
jgi:hypothetical protein